ncbi:hypothetical protein [Streptomyces sp. NPDC056144]|uniref:hypothetical protein n=1 Tax=unclassified Streptomyces TaxID=2593676 RepID=UPI0035E1EECA
MTSPGRKARVTAAVAGAVLGATGAGTAALAGAQSWTVPLIGLAVAVLTWSTHTAVDHLTGASEPSPSRPPSPRAPSTGRNTASTSRTDLPPAEHRSAPADIRPWLVRASVAVAKMDRHLRDATDPTLTQAFANASERGYAAVERLRARAAAVALIDTTTAGTDREALRRDEERLRKEAAAHDTGPVREAKLASVRAVSERRDSLTRLADLRDHMTAAIEATTLRLEAAVERGSMLLSLRAADEAGTRPLDLSALDDELEAVQAGLDKLDEISRVLDDGDPAP